MLTNAIAFLFTPRSISIYEKQVNARVDSGAHAGEFFFDILERLRVSDATALDKSFISFVRGTTLAEVLEAVADTLQPVFPVLNRDGTLYGLIDLADIRILLGLPMPPSGLVIAQDLCFESFSIVTPEESLATALRKMRNTRLEALPVVASTGSRQAVGLVSRRDIGNAYHDYLYRTDQTVSAASEHIVLTRAPQPIRADAMHSSPAPASGVGRK